MAKKQQKEPRPAYEVGRGKPPKHSQFKPGQSGNPGSPYYDNFVDYWATGRYYPLWVMGPEEVKDQRVKWIMHFE